MQSKLIASIAEAKQQPIIQLRENVYNPNLIFLHKAFTTIGNTGCILEGSSRSGKTYSCIDFLVWICSTYTGLTIHIIKETYNSFKTTLYDDFNRRLPAFGIASPFANKQEVDSFKLFGNKINLLGADKPSKFHGASCDIAWYNEFLDIPKAVFDQQEMRTRMFWFGDLNPKATEHWVYNSTDRRSDVMHLKTTFADNPYISTIEKRKILSYCPYHPDDASIEDVKKRRPHPVNVPAGTADDYMWNVYGMGLRSAPEGLVFQHVNYIAEWPANIANPLYGLDFGYTNSPSVLVRCAIQKQNLYAQKLFYTPTPSTNELVPLLKQFIKNKEDDCIWADPSGEDGGRGMISQLRRLGYNVISTNTFPGSIKHGISVMKKYKQFWVDDPDVKREQTNYKFQEVNGIRLDKPIDDFNHFIDAVRMPVMSNYK